MMFSTVRITPERIKPAIWLLAALFMAVLAGAAAWQTGSLRESAVRTSEEKVDRFVSGAEAALNHNMLSIDLLLFGGPSGGKFMTSFGPEKAFKTTTMTECLVWYIAQEIKWRRYIAANPEASRPPPITLVYWDYENSLHTSDSGAIFSMLRKWVPDVRRVEVFGDDANLPAVYVYSEIPDLETMFEHIELLSEAIPPMAMINGRWFWKMESLPAGVPRDEGVSKLTGVPCVPAPQPIPAQVLVFTDSIPAMAPRAGIGPDKSAAMALQARAFSQALTTTTTTTSI